MVDILVGVCYRPFSQDGEADEKYCRQLGEVSQLPALILVDDKKSAGNRTQQRENSLGGC